MNLDKWLPDEGELRYRWASETSASPPEGGGHYLPGCPVH